MGITELDQRVQAVIKRMEILPTWEARHDYNMIVLEAGKLVDAEDPTAEIDGEWWHEGPGKDPTTDDVVDSVAAAMIAERIHEVAEFLRLDGKRIAEPHPDGGVGIVCKLAMKAWQEYRTAHPAN
jgi:hypothetical protein